MHGNFNKPAKAGPQDPLERFSDETERQRALHREIALEHGRRRWKRGSPKSNVRIRELERVFVDRYGGAVLPDDDSGRDDIFVMANHLAHLDTPDRRILAWVRRWAPWHGDDKTADLIEAVLRKPLKWTADALAKRLGVDYATRSRLRLTTVGAIDCGKAKRARLRRKRNNETKQARRTKAGAAVHAASVAQTKPWLALGISRRTWYRQRQVGTGGTDSGTAYPKGIVVSPNRCHAAAPWRVSAAALGAHAGADRVPPLLRIALVASH
jgi:hypothetical protein